MLSLRPLHGATLAAALLVASTQLVAETGSNTSPMIDRIIVSATGHETLYVETPASASIIEGEDLRELPARDVMDLLRTVPGISLTGVGLSGRRTVHSDYQHGWMPLESIERIEVIRGPMSALYGSDAMSGVVNIITRAVPQSWDSRASLQAGVRDDGNGGDRRRAAIQAGGPLIDDTLGIRAYLSLLNEDEVSDPDHSALSQIEGRESLAGGLDDDHRWELYEKVVQMLYDSAGPRPANTDRDINIFMLYAWADLSAPMVFRHPCYREEGHRVVDVVVNRLRKKLREKLP